MNNSQSDLGASTDFVFESYISGTVWRTPPGTMVYNDFPGGFNHHYHDSESFPHPGFFSTFVEAKEIDSSVKLDTPDNDCRGTVTMGSEMRFSDIRF
jgi:hypothetical protein